ncbi:activator of Hsp90 ATPase 1-like family protein [Asticcacaulis biprosthecium C19]|uniref:Activator of Hsp90 ATPase 1-like family protein n=1 Tax=Asticcacaulis biprosthecium C19 TaxID=715226 RepID=F4QN98_9CAUL|nr:SRPBCC domain-containing protein [Asticcacaulis biprosthecium]EGF90806.1 activator of Hsp90 ATPase 1-like family protein [Asticcacaulis biprosthecium C19]
MTAVHATFVIEKTYPHPVTKVFAAFAQSDIKQSWFGHGSGGTYENDFRVGGIERSSWVMDATTPFPGAVLSSEALYLDIVPDRRIACGSNMMMNGTPFSGSLATFEFAADGDGAKLTLTHHGAYFENADGPQMREHGWGELLKRLGEAL